MVLSLCLSIVPGYQLLRASGTTGNERHSGLNAHLRTEVRGVVILRNGIERPAKALAAIVDPQRTETGPPVAVVDRGFAVAPHAVEPNAPLLVLAVAAAVLQMEAVIAGAHEERGHTRERYFPRPLGDDVDGAADAAAGGDTVDERARALEQFDPLDDLGGHTLGGDTARTCRLDRRRATPESHGSGTCRRTRSAGGGPDRSVVDQRIRRRSRLLILDQLRRVVRVLNGTFMTLCCRAGRASRPAPPDRRHRPAPEFRSCGSFPSWWLARCRHGPFGRLPGRDAGRALRRATRPHRARHTRSLLRRIDGHRRQHLRRCALRPALRSSHTGQA